MQVCKSIIDIKRLINEIKIDGKTISLVPTMGNLHAGHICLLDKAKDISDFVLTSIFVNPTQFSQGEDFEKYPRTLESDLELLNKSDAVFCPSIEDIYPKRLSSNLNISENKIANLLCGKFRAGHFNGVLGIVNKLFNITKPDFAIFGEKDYQQLKLINIMNENLNMGVNIISCPTVREESGLALSSRNSYLSISDKNKAAKIYKTMYEVKKLYLSGINDLLELKNYSLECLVNDFDIQYIEILDSNFNSNKIVKPQSRIFICAYLGNVRLIDNLEL